MQTVIRPNAKRVEFSNDHRRNFLNAIRTRRTPIFIPIHAAFHDEADLPAGGIAMRLQRKLRWDPKNANQFINDEQAEPDASPAIRTLAVHGVDMRVLRSPVYVLLRARLRRVVREHSGMAVVCGCSLRQLRTRATACRLQSVPSDESGWQTNAAGGRGKVRGPRGRCACRGGGSL